MTQWQIALKSLTYYLRTNLAIALGVAAATAVLTGALIVGDSMRHSLRALTMQRLGKIDEMIVSDGFFREKLATEIQQTDVFKSNYQNVTPVIMFPGGTVQYKPGDVARRAGQVTVLGVKDDFWSFENSTEMDRPSLSGNKVIINQTIADDLQILAADVQSGKAKITVRIPKQTQLPADSALGKKKDLIESLVDLQVIKIIPTEGLGRFGLHPTQTDPLNVYLPIALLQERLEQTVLKHKADPAQANVLMVASKGELPSEEITRRLRSEMKPSLADDGLLLKRVTEKFGDETVYDYWSLSSDQLVLDAEATKSIAKTFPNAKPVFTYLANELLKPDQTKGGVPFSMVSSIDFDSSFQPVSAISKQPIKPLGENEIVLNQWAAEDMGFQVGEMVKVLYFQPETTHGSQTESSVQMKLVDIAQLVEPETPIEIRRNRVKRATYATRPAVNNDADLTPEVPGLTDADTVAAWDLPFPTKGRLRPQDDSYWNDYRTTPKAFVSLATGQKLWTSRFGSTTSFRIPVDAGSQDQIRDRLLAQFSADEVKLGIHIVPIKRRGLAASSGSTPFDVLFLALSMFVIGAALILVSLLFRLGLQQRASEVGLLKATGFGQKQIRNLWLSEMLIVSLIGAVIGVLLGVAYAWSMIWGLSTWWVGAISRPFLTLHVSPISLIAGLLSGILICVLTIAWSLRRIRKQPIRGLLAGNLESEMPQENSRRGMLGWLAPVLIVVALGLAAMATQLAGEAQAGSFMGAGFLMLTAFLMLVYQWLQKPNPAEQAGRLSLSRLAMLSAKRNPLRSTLTIGLVAVASFLIVAVSSFRLTPNEAGTARFDWVAQSSQPVFEDLSTVEGQEAALGSGFQLSEGTEVVSIRFKSGEDASCNNLYQSTQPRALGMPPNFVGRFDKEHVTSFAWGGSLAQSKAEKQNPWHLLDSIEAHTGTEDDPIPVMMDKNTANYSLKIYMLGTVKKVVYDSGETFHYKVVGFLANTILQGSLIMSETDFVAMFPDIGGYQYFLIRDRTAGDLKIAPKVTKQVPSNVDILEDRLGDQGFDARSAPKLLANFMTVQNTYLSTFQTLGALGLLLGTFGLAAVQIRSVLERKKELGLLRAVGFKRQKLSTMVLLENAWLLLMGLAVGVGAALFTTVPHWFVGTASVPWLALAAIFAAIVFVGLLAGWLASRVISRMPLLESLRS